MPVQIAKDKAFFRRFSPKEIPYENDTTQASIESAIASNIIDMYDKSESFRLL